MPDQGVMGFFSDPGGAMIGVWQPGEHKGSRLVGEPGAPAYHELHTRDYDAAVSFYRNIFGWDVQVMSDADDFRYTNLMSGGEPLAGIMDVTGMLPEEVPAHWKVYFSVHDIDEALTQVSELGGTVVRSVDETPFGRIAQVADPTGAMFSLHMPNA